LNPHDPEIVFVGPPLPEKAELFHVIARFRYPEKTIHENKSAVLP
jgi:hypothetical protein